MRLVALGMAAAAPVHAAPVWQPVQGAETEQHGASLSGTVARVCALVGGVMTVANIIDKIVYQSGHLLLKNRMGKLS